MQSIYEESIVFVVGLSKDVHLAADVAALSLKIAVSASCNQAETTEKVASAMFPFLLILPKVLSRSLFYTVMEKDYFNLANCNRFCK